jgi:hypothetical protein
MALPPLNAAGLLPVGIHDCSMEDIRRRFGVFQGSDRRPQLFARFVELADAMRGSGLFESLVVDGSFVTSKPAPNDIDLLAVLRLGHDFQRDLPMAQYGLVARKLLRRRFGFDVVLAEAGSSLYEEYVEFFSRVREAPELRKGLLRLRL